MLCTFFFSSFSSSLCAKLESAVLDFLPATRVRFLTAVLRIFLPDASPRFHQLYPWSCVCPRCQCLASGFAGALQWNFEHPPDPHQEAAWSFQEILWLPLLISTIYNPARKGNIASPSALYLQSKGNVRVSDSWLAPNPHPPHSGSL